MELVYLFAGAKNVKLLQSICNFPCYCDPLPQTQINLNISFPVISNGSVCGVADSLKTSEPWKQIMNEWMELLLATHNRKILK